MDLKESNGFGDAIDKHWYYQSKAKSMVSFINGDIPNKILDVGAGSGFFSRFLLLNTNAKESTCIDINYPADREETLSNKKLIFRTKLDRTDATLVLFMDVLEHVDEDVSLLRDYASKMPSGSQFLITVPAFQLLWSSHDDFLGHKRRYNLKHLESVVREAGLTIERSAYYFALVFPIAAAQRLVERVIPSNASDSQLQVHSTLANSILKLACSIERVFMKANRLLGLSVFCLARKP